MGKEITSVKILSIKSHLLSKIQRHTTNNRKNKKTIGKARPTNAGHAVILGLTNTAKEDKVNIPNTMKKKGINIAKKTFLST